MCAGKLVEFPPNENIRWFTQYDKVLALASWLLQKNEFRSMNEMLSYFEKPYKWGAKWYEYAAEQEGVSD